jgi:hypothetical protein
LCGWWLGGGELPVIRIATSWSIIQSGRRGRPRFRACKICGSATALYGVVAIHSVVFGGFAARELANLSAGGGTHRIWTSKPGHRYLMQTAANSLVHEATGLQIGCASTGAGCGKSAASAADPAQAPNATANANRFTGKPHVAVREPNRGWQSNRSGYGTLLPMRNSRQKHFG